QPSLKSVKWDKNIDRWISPFIMSGFNTKVVRRTNSIMDYPYGKDFVYAEVSSYKKGLKGYLKAVFMLITLIALQLTLKSRFLLLLMKKFFFPLPGQGPAREKRENGFFNLDIVGSIKKTKKISLNVYGNSDPGYSATATMVAESALSILLNEDKLSNRFGVLTPASGIGEVLVERLKDKGIQFNLNG
ncbi:MAG: saccharopine dehydrogenase, partial [Candidatus Neomarinimicrobiota bacterium]